MCATGWGSVRVESSEALNENMKCFKVQRTNQVGTRWTLIGMNADTGNCLLTKSLICKHSADPPGLIVFPVQSTNSAV